MKLCLAVLGALALGFILGLYISKRYGSSELTVPGLTTEEVREALRAAPGVVKGLSMGDDEAAMQLAVLYRLMVAGETEKAKERTRQMLDEYYTKAAPDAAATDTRRGVVKRVGEVLGK